MESDQEAYAYGQTMAAYCERVEEDLSFHCLRLDSQQSSGVGGPLFTAASFAAARVLST